MDTFDVTPAACGATYADRLEEFGERIAVVTEAGERISYAELARRADAFAAQLGGRRRLLCVEAANVIEPLVALLAGLRAGSPVLLLASDGPNDTVLERYRPDARFHRDGAEWRLDLSDPPSGPLHPDLALLLATSGSTGAAKLVRLSHSAIDANAASIIEYLQIGQDDAAITSLPFHYSYGLSVVASHLACGARLLLTDRSVMEPEFWLFAEREGVTSIAGVPYNYQLFESIGLRGNAPSTLRTMTQAGGRLPPETGALYGKWMRERGGRFFTMYGQTEATARMAYLPPERQLQSPGAIGVPIPGGAFRLRDEDGADVTDAGGPGELIYSGPNVMMGYAERPEDLARGPELTELPTGDLAERREDGLYYIVGRKSRFSKLFGLRISLNEIEDRLRGRNLQTDVAGDDSLIVICGAHLPPDLALELSDEYGLPPECFQVLDVSETPRLPSGKVDYVGILTAGRAAQPERSDGRPSVKRAYQRAFPNRPIRREDSFVSLGGDSLRYVTLSLDLENSLGHLPQNWEELPIADLEALRRNRLKPPSRWSVSQLETEVLARAAAIIAVVAHHAGYWKSQGGALVLIMLVGFNMARYQRLNFAGGRSWRTVRSLLGNVILPGYLITVAYVIYDRKLDVASLFMVSNFRGRFGSFLEPYWFLEALLQCTLILAAIFSLRPMQRFAAEAPWRLGLCMVAAFVAGRFALFETFHHDWLARRTPDAVLYVIALGWTVQQSRTTAQKLVAMGFVVAVASFNLVAPWQRNAIAYDIENYAVMMVAALLLWCPRVVLPNPIKSLAALIAAASFWIYLTHEAIIYVFVQRLHERGVILPLLVSTVAGVMAWQVVTLAKQSVAIRSGRLEIAWPGRAGRAAAAADRTYGG